MLVEVRLSFCFGGDGMKKGTIYKIVTKHNGFIYIGQTVQKPRRRWRGHLSKLRAHSHNNPILQNVFDKYGKADFIFEVIEECSVEEIDERERYWIAFYDSTNREKGYNLASGGSVQKKCSQETVEKMKLSARGNNSKLTPEQVTEIKKSIIAGLSFTEIAQNFGVSGGCIYRIKILQNWAYVSPELNEELRNTNTSRRVKYLNSEEIENCRRRILNGEPAVNLARQYDFSYKRFLKIFHEEIKLKQKNEVAIELAKKLFFENRSVKEILSKTGLTLKQYNSAVFGLESKRHEFFVKYTGQAKAEGKTSSEIAKDLNVNRCTITVYWKEYKQKYANTVISQ